MRRIKRQSRSKSPAGNSAGSVRIIAGRLRGSKLVFGDAEGLRPTPDRVRETLFNWLGSAVVDAHCLDLFCGSGALAFEAISRGAGEVLALEKNAAVYRDLCENRQRLKADDLKLLNRDCYAWLAEQRSATEAGNLEQGSRVFDILFIDPPFSEASAPALFESIERSGICSDSALVYVESPADGPDCPMPAGWQKTRDKRAGTVRYCLYQRSG